MSYTRIINRFGRRDLSLCVRARARAFVSNDVIIVSAHRAEGRVLFPFAASLYRSALQFRSIACGRCVASRRSSSNTKAAERGGAAGNDAVYEKPDYLIGNALSVCGTGDANNANNANNALSPIRRPPR